MCEIIAEDKRVTRHITLVDEIVLTSSFFSAFMFNGPGTSRKPCSCAVTQHYGALQCSNIGNLCLRFFEDIPEGQETVWLTYKIYIQTHSQKQRKGVGGGGVFMWCCSIASVRPSVWSPLFATLPDYTPRLLSSITNS